MKNVIIIEDNTDIAHLIEMHLNDMGVDTCLHHEGNGGLSACLQQSFDLIILDLMLPGLDGMEICRQIRQQQIHTPVLMLTAKSSEIDRVLGLECGADDYLTKPFSIHELIARVKAIFRRMDYDQQKTVSPQISIGALKLDVDKHCARLNEQELELTATEFDLLIHFAKHPGQVFSRSQLLDSVWGYGHDGYEHTVNSHINRLRGKIELDPAHPHYIQTVWGVGYKMTGNSL